MPKLDAAAVAALLAEFGRRTALRGGSPYRARAYTRASQNLRALVEPLSKIIARRRLREIPGVGEAIADIIATLHTTGTHPSLETMRREAPAGVLELLEIPGLLADRALKLNRELGIRSIDDLEQAARQDRLRSVKGFGAALQARILEGIEARRNKVGQIHIHRAAELLQAAKADLRNATLGLKRIVPAGDFRRGCELIQGLSLVAEAPSVRGGADTLSTGGELSVHLADRAHYGITLLLATGSQAHLDDLRARAARRGFVLDSGGLRKRGKLIAAQKEAEIYSALGLAFIEPELREGRGEINLAAQGKLPILVNDSDIRGAIHAHTDRSDGMHTLEQMAAAARKRGYEYFGVTDHSKSAHYAGGLSIEEIAEQHSEIERLNAKCGDAFRIFKGIESDILPDGSLDYPDDVLDRFDFIVASVHSRFRMDRRQQTERILRAIAHPRTTILGHMTGRQLLRRPGYEVDVEKILRACARHDVAVEINANPWRLDLDWRWHARALEIGCMMSIDPDAHSTAELDLTHWGIEMARKGGVPKERVLNCLTLTQLMQHLRKRRRRRRAPAGPYTTNNRI